MVHFMLAILACRKVRQKDDESPFRPPPVVRVRYDGVGPDGTSRPMSYRVHEQIQMPPYEVREAQARGSRESYQKQGRPSSIPKNGEAAVSPTASTNGTTPAGALEKGGS